MPTAPCERDALEAEQFLTKLVCFPYYSPNNGDTEAVLRVRVPGRCLIMSNRGGLETGNLRAALVSLSAKVAFATAVLLETCVRGHVSLANVVLKSQRLGDLFGLRTDDFVGRMCHAV